MKKIIWVFGLPGSGKSELLRDVKEDKNNIRDILNIDSDDISYIDISHDFSNLTYDYNESEKRSKLMVKRVTEAVDSNSKYLIISGQFIDLKDVTENTLRSIEKTFPNIEKDIVFLNPSNLDVLYERLKNTDWFKSNYESNLNRFPRAWLDVSVKYLSDKVYSNEDNGYKIIEIDTTEGYNISSNKINRR